MAVLSDAAYSQQLFGVATSYSYLDYSVIPIHGNNQSGREKVAALDWKPFQERRATSFQFNRWFRVEGFGGIAIVTGSVSNLIVLDFDEQTLADEFARRYPFLTETRIVISAGRRLPHYYYHIPSDIQVKSRHGTGADLLADGHYVVAPPTVIGNDAYIVLRGGQPRTLTIPQIRLIERFIDEKRLVPPEAPQKAENAPIQVNVSPLPVLPDDAVALYQSYAPQLGRNEALFKVALKVRDSGWLLEDALVVLVNVHVQQQPTGHHKPETPQQRQREAEATIRSAFSRPPRKRAPVDKPVQTLPTSLREHLLQRKMGYLVRVLDGLLLNNVTQGMALSEKQITTLLQKQVGRHSVLKALTASYDDGTPIFVLAAPSPRPPSHTDVATAIAGEPNNKCLLFRATKSDKNQRGRPVRLYHSPDIETLCARFGVKFTKSDPLDKADLRSTKTYRQAMQRELIKRKPGLYSKKWLANRLGITKRSLQRYREELPIMQKAMFRQTTITWQTINLVPDKVEVYGAFLEDNRGKRYPAKLEVARRLLRRDGFVVYKRQDVNYYWHPDTPPSPLVMLGMRPESPQNAPISHFEYSLEPGDERQEKSQPDPQNRVFAPLPPTVDEQQLPLPGIEVAKPVNVSVPKKAQKPVNIALKREYKPKPKRYYRQPLPNLADEIIAMRLYERTQQICDGKKGYMSKAVARRLTEQYGIPLVKKLLQVFAWRDGIENPAGFAVVYLRSESKRGELEMWM